MTLEADHLVYAEQQPSLVVDIRRASPDDLRYVYATWLSEYKYSSGRLARAPYDMYRATVGKQLHDLVWADRTRVVAAYMPDGRIAGWLAYVPGRSVSTVHWCYTRFRLDGEKLRRRGVMAALLEAADLGSRFAYTFRGAKEHRLRGKQDRAEHAPRLSIRGDTSDEPIVAWLRGRGVTAAFVDIAEWLR